MKVLHILHELKFSGAETMYVNAAPIFQRLGCELEVVNTTEHLGEFTPAFTKAGFVVHHWPYSNSIGKKYHWCEHLIKYIRNNHVDIVHIHDTGLKWTASLCARIAGCACIYTFHSVFPTHWYSRPYHICIRYTAKHFHRCIFQAISQTVYDNEVQTFFNKTILVNNWYDSTRFYPITQEERNAVRKELNVAEDDIAVISIGRCDDNKRHMDIIQAIARLKNTHYHYIHVGDGELNSEEQKTAEVLHIKSNCHFVGNTNKVRKYLCAADIYVMTSKYEGISLTTMEAMACGIPCILYDIASFHEFNSKYESAKIIPPTVNSLSLAIEELKYDIFKTDSLKANALKTVEEKYNMLTNATHIYKLYLKSVDKE